MTVIMIAEVLKQRIACQDILGKLDDWLPTHEILAPPDVQPTTFEPVSNFGEKRIHPITKKTVVRVNKVSI